MMMMPSIFGENLFDDWFDDFPFYTDKAMKNTEKKLYGNKASRIMKTDIKEHDKGYELIIDLPGFTKDEVKASIENGYLTSALPKALTKMKKKKTQAVTSVRSATQVPAREASMLVRMSNLSLIHI